MNWLERYNELCCFVEKNNRLPDYKNKDERSIYNWCCNQKRKYNENRLSLEFQMKLESINSWNWGAKEIREENIFELKSFIQNKKRKPLVSKKQEQFLGRFVYRLKEEDKVEIPKQDKDLFNYWFN